MVGNGWEWVELIKLQVCNRLHKNLSYDESLSRQPGAWLEEKNIFTCMQSQNLKKYPILKFKIIPEHVSFL